VNGCPGRTIPSNLTDFPSCHVFVNCTSSRNDIQLDREYAESGDLSHGARDFLTDMSLLRPEV